MQICWPMRSWNQASRPGVPLSRLSAEPSSNPDRTLNRHALAAIVFRNPSELRRLEQIIHPPVAREQTRLARQAARKDSKAVVIYDVPAPLRSRNRRTSG